MKILAYTENYATETVTFIVNELKALETNHEIMLVYSNRINPERNNLKLMFEIPYRFNKVINKIRWWLEQTEIYFPILNYRFKKRINRVIEEFNPEIIHCHFGTDFLKVAANLKEENRRIPILISFYGFDVTERIANKSVLRQYRKYMSMINVHSIAVSKNLVHNVNTRLMPRNPSKLLHSGVDTEFYKKKDNTIKTSAEFVFLQVASFYQKKGHRYTLEAFKKFIEQDARHNYKFIIAGFGPLKSEIEDQIQELNLEKYVKLQGPVTPAEMVLLGSHADCFVHMSITADNGEEEGLPNVLLEAMALELPVVSTRHAGIPEIILDGVNGILCDEKNISEYVDAFKRIVDWSKLPRNRERIIQLFSLQAHMNYLLNIYERMKDQTDTNIS